MGWILYSGVYVLIFSWVDIIKYCCCKKHTYEYKYSYIDTKIEERIIISEDDKNCIWLNCEGTREDTWIRNGCSLFHCNNYKWKSKTFKDFIWRLKTDNEISKVNNIAVILTPQVQSFQNSIVSNLDNTFIDVENELFKEYPMYKNKENFFLLNGNAIKDKNKTLKELGIKNSDNIIICENTLDKSTNNINEN